MVHETDETTLSYFLPLKTPTAMKIMALEVYDPTFFISFGLAEGETAVKLASAPEGCAINISRPKTAPPSAQGVSESFFENLTAASSYGTQFANKAIVACP